MTTRTPTIARVARALAADPAALTDRELLARFVRDGDQAAFAAVAARHTGLVLGVCRRGLSPAADAEDACQAVFLLLAKKAAKVRWQGSAAGWLYTVARRVARNARLSAERRARRESKAAVPELVAPVDVMTGRELAAILDEELGRLAPRYRDPLVLCCLQGLTQDEAAVRLGVRLETLRSQLKRGRKKLADALAARGCDLGIALLAVTAAVATAGPRLVKSIQAVATGTPSPAVVQLARASAASPLLTPKSMMLAATIAAAALGLGAALTPPSSAQPPKDGVKPAVEKVEAPAVTRVGGDRFRATAPVGDARFSPDGKRIVGFAGSTLYVWDAADGSVVRTMDTKLGPVPDPGWPYERDRVFAAHPKDTRVAIGGTRGDTTLLQLWDYETGKMLAEEVAKYPGLKALAWTPDGTRLVDRSNSVWVHQAKGGKLTGALLVRDGDLKLLGGFPVPAVTNEWGTLVLPLPGNKEFVLWQSDRDATIYDLATGRVVRPIGYSTRGLPSGLAVSPDGQTLVVTCTEKIALVELATGVVRHQLPVHRGGWEMPRPLFSPDGRTVYVFDFRPFAYDVATGKEKWAGVFPTLHNLSMKTCDVSPDGSTLLCMHGHRIARIDTATGTERDRPEGPSRPAGITWSPDGKTLFTRTVKTERTWTAWDAATGKRLYDLLPTGFVPNNEWKMMPDLFFIHGGKEIVAGLEKAERNERVGPKELLVFDAATGKPLRRLGHPLPAKLFQWALPIAVEPDGSSVVMQVYTVSGPPGMPAMPGGPAAIDTSREYTFHTTRWDPVNQKVLKEWEVTGHRTDDQRHYAPYAVNLGIEQPDWDTRTRKQAPAKVRCYSLADGRLVHELATGFGGLDADRVQGSFLLTTGFDNQFVTRGSTMSYLPKPPFAYDVWDLPGRQGVRLFELATQATVVLGPNGRYVLKVRDDGAVEVFEPFVLKKAVATMTAPARPEKFEFSSDGGRVAVSLVDTSVVVWETAPWTAAADAGVAKAVPADLGPLWNDLAGDAATGLRAARLLAAAGDKGIALLKARVSAVQPPDPARVKGLIADLDAARFAAREQAETDLRELGSLAEAHLREALKSGASAEAGKRINSLLAAIAAHKLTAAQLRELRAVQALRWQDTAAARALLAEWSKGDPAASLTRAAKSAGVSVK